MTAQLVTVGVQVASPQTPGTNAPQVWFVGQPPQSGCRRSRRRSFRSTLPSAAVQPTGAHGFPLITMIAPSAPGQHLRRYEARDSPAVRLEVAALPKTMSKGTSAAPAVRRNRHVCSICFGKSLVIHFYVIFATKNWQATVDKGLSSAVQQVARATNEALAPRRGRGRTGGLALALPDVFTAGNRRACRDGRTPDPVTLAILESRCNCSLDPRAASTFSRPARDAGGSSRTARAFRIPSTRSVHGWRVSPP